MTPQPCRCFEVPIDHTQFDSTHIGTDDAEGRFAEVSIERCRSCGQPWLRYFYEVEAYSRSGRWYRCIISQREAASMTAARALDVLCGKDFYLCGGNYFQSTGMRCNCRLERKHL